MTPLGTAALIIGLLMMGAAATWYLLITTEGVYLGRRVVIWLYDVYAKRYDRIKKFDGDWESIALGQPLVDTLAPLQSPLILDVATGTARLPLCLLAEPGFRGQIIGLDYSREMLRMGAEKLRAFATRQPEGYVPPVTLIHQPAEALPFADETFDAVCCLEALEFTPRPDAVLAELVRVVRPGGLLLITNRKGPGARLMPGKTQPGRRLMERLKAKFGLTDVSLRIWQVDYEQIWATKPGWPSESRKDHSSAPESLVRCPTCGRCTLRREPGGSGARLRCEHCTATIEIAGDGVVEYARARPGRPAYHRMHR